MDAADDTRTATVTSDQDPADFIDELGRRAGSALRRPAPEGGPADLERRRRRHQRRTISTIAAVAVLAAAVLLVQWGRDDSTEPVSPTNTVTETLDAAAFFGSLGDTDPDMVVTPNLCVHSHCYDPHGFTTTRVTHSATGMSIDPDELTAFVVLDALADGRAIYSVGLSAADVPDCGQGLLMNVAWGADGGLQQQRMVVTGRSDALGTLSGVVTGPAGATGVAWDLYCNGGMVGPSAAATGPGVITVDFTTTDAPDRAVSWVHAPICRRHAPGDCLLVEASWDRVTGSFTGDTVRATTRVEQDGVASPGSTSLVSFEGEVAGCGNGDVSIAEWSTGPDTGEWSAIPGSNGRGLPNVTGGGTVVVTGTTHHYVGTISCTSAG